MIRIIRRELYRFFLALRGRVDFRCGACGVDVDVAPRWPRLAVCYDHCPDHRYEYDSSVGYRRCSTCSKPAPYDWCYGYDER